MSFQTAINDTPLLKDHLKNGLRALGSNSSKVQSTDNSKCEGSVDIDSAVKSTYPNDSRWDYAVGYNGKTYFIEVHSAKTDEVKSVLKKLQWLKDFLTKDSPDFDKERKSFHWVASSGNHILPNSSQARQLAKSGIIVVGQLTL
jgi:hypothetical protein